MQLKCEEVDFAPLYRMEVRLGYRTSGESRLFSKDRLGGQCHDGIRARWGKGARVVNAAVDSGRWSASRTGRSTSKDRDIGAD